MVIFVTYIGALFPALVSDPVQRSRPMAHTSIQVTPGGKKRNQNTKCNVQSLLQSLTGPYITVQTSCCLLKVFKVFNHLTRLRMLA